MKQGSEAQPISEVKWVNRDELHANAYNPNKVFPVELELLVQSILTCGWTQPIVIRSNNEIVDGFHRWLVSNDARILEMTGGMVPVVTLPDEMGMAEQVSATITHNRARGSHYVMSMADIVRSLKDEQGVDDQWIQQHLGMEQEEIERLYDNAGSPDTKGDPDETFADGWVPDFGRMEGG